MRALIPIMAGLLAVSPAKANWGGGSGGNLGTGSLSVLGQDKVELQQENLQIDLHRDHAQVRVEYRFHNSGEEVTVRAGFPGLVWASRYDQPGAKVDPARMEVQAYRIEVDGKQVRHALVVGKQLTSTKPWFDSPHTEDHPELEGLLPVMAWLVSEIPFGKGQTRTVVITYRSRYQWANGGVGDDVTFIPDTFRYLLSTGSVWSGPITRGRVKITAVGVDSGRIRLQPGKRFQRQGDAFVWEFESLEPTAKDDLIIEVDKLVTTIGPLGGESGGHAGAPRYHYTLYKDEFYFDGYGYSVKASSVLGNKRKKYGPANVADVQPATAWVEGAKGSGEGERLTLILDKPMRLSHIGMMGGYFKSEKIYHQNNRIAEVEIVLNGKHKVTRALRDDFHKLRPDHPRAFEFVDLGGFQAKVKTVEIILKKVYKGSKFDDTCISEVILRRKLDKRPQVSGGR